MVKKSKGFTLLEIVAVISLMIIIASISIPVYTNIVDKQKLKTDLAVALQLEQHAKTYYIDKKDTDTSNLKKYIEEVYGQMPKSKYNNSDFSVSIDSSTKKVSVSAGNKNFIINGVEQELIVD